MLIEKRKKSSVANCVKDIVFETLIPRNVRLSEAPSYGLPINKYDPHCLGALAYRSLAKEFLDRQQIIKFEQIQKPFGGEPPPSAPFSNA